MTVSEIMGKITAHMIEGLMLHEQMGQYYRFLGMNGYAENHDWHYGQESIMYRFVRDYYITHYNMLPPKVTATNPNAIPDGWYRYKRDEVDTNTKRSAVKNGLTAWRTWEEDTKALYQKMYSELMALGEVAFASVVESIIVDTDKELADVMAYFLRHKADDYSMESIMAEQ